jgi:hypothetical protein
MLMTEAWNIEQRKAAGIAPDLFNPHEPDEMCGDMHCYFHHVDEPRERDALICGECGHVFLSPENLRLEWLTNAPPDLEGQAAPPADEIDFCPLCSHSF